MVGDLKLKHTRNWLLKLFSNLDQVNHNSYVVYLTYDFGLDIYHFLHFDIAFFITQKIRGTLWKIYDFKFEIFIIQEQQISFYLANWTQMAEWQNNFVKLKLIYLSAYRNPTWSYIIIIIIEITEILKSVLEIELTALIMIIVIKLLLKNSIAWLKRVLVWYYFDDSQI